MTRLARNFILFLLFACPAPLCAQSDLPAESILPGGPSLPKFSHESLPAESEVPGLPVSPSNPQNQQTPQKSPSEAAQLPGEDKLPQFLAVQQIVLPEDPPWLRLSLNGPTAPMQTVCFSSDGKHLLAGGADKMVHSWIAAPRKAGQRQRWIYETPVRWQVQRATRGDIHTIAPMDGKFAFAGIGASALTGEVILADQQRMMFERTLFDVDKGARSQILSLAGAGKGLYALDSEGTIQAWSSDPQTGKWSFVTGESPAEAFDEAGNSLRPWRLRGSKIAASHDGKLYFPVATRSDQGIPYWRIGTWRPGVAATLVPSIRQEFPGGIGSLACDRAGKRIVAADISDASVLVLTDVTSAAASQAYSLAANVRDVALSAEGTKVAAILARSPQGPFELHIWDWQRGAKPKLLSTVKLDTVATGCAFRSDGTLLAVTQQQAIDVYDLDQLDKAVRLTTPLITPAKVGFTLDGKYQVVIQPQPGTGNEEGESILFDTGKRHYSAVKTPPPIVPANPWRGSWSLKQELTEQGTKLNYFVMQGDQKVCQIPESILGTSRVTSVCWLADGEQRDVPARIVVGTVGRNHAYLLDISDPQNVSVVREFRGHSSAVRSVGVSVDQRYLVTGSDDGLVNLWKLSEEDAASSMQNLWGAEFEQIDGKLVARKVIPDGPLYYRGVRDGDVIQSIAIRDDAKERDERTINDPETIEQMLAKTSGETMLRFQIARNGAAQKPFYLHPAWQPLASLATTAQREWAYWTPYGYYDASFNGHRIFGWQINQGIDQAPDFFLAAELKQQLEKPRVMERLLEEGSLSAAMRVAKTHVPFNLHNKLEALASLRPQIDIETPTNEEAIDGGTTFLEATVKVPPGAELIRPKAFANGVPAAELVEDVRSPSDDLVGSTHKYRWRMALPPDRQVRFDVVAGTTDGILSTQSITAQQEVTRRAAPPRIFVIAAGISAYDDQQIPQLDFAAANAQAFVKTIETHAKNAQVESIVLTDSNVTQPLWDVAADTMLQRLRDTARPEDVVLFFLSGHGVRDVETEEYYFLTSNSQFADVAGRRYERCISADAFQEYFAGLPCRKIAILDTCHSGAIQPLKQDDLKVMLRALEDDVILTITASEGDEEAFESRERQLGRFTARLVEGISGQADLPAYGGNGDGMVSLNETAQYVEATVPQDAAAAGQSQHPSIFPRDLFPLIDVNLATSEAH